MDDLIEWEFLEPGVKFRFEDRILLVESIHDGWIAVCKSIQPEQSFVLVERQEYNAWRKREEQARDLGRIRERYRERRIAEQNAIFRSMGIPGHIVDMATSNDPG